MSPKSPRIELKISITRILTNLIVVLEIARKAFIV